MTTPEGGESPLATDGGSRVRGAQFEGAVSVQTTSAEHSDVRASRLRREEANARHKIWMEKATFTAAAVLVVVVLVVSLGVVVAPRASPESKNQAWRVVYLVIGALVGYLAGRSGTPSS